MNLVWLFSIFFVSSVETAEVTVTVPMQGRDTAVAIEEARKEAFKKAVAQKLPAGLSEEERKQKLDQSARYVTGFQMTEQKEEAGNLIARFRLELDFGEDEQERQADYGDYFSRFAVEWYWNDPRNSLSVVELRKKLTEDFGLEVHKIKLSGGSLWLELGGSTNPQASFRRLRNRYGAQAEMNFYSDPAGILQQNNAGNEAN